MSTIITKRQFPGYHKYEMELAGRPLTLEVGKLAHLAREVEEGEVLHPVVVVHHLSLVRLSAIEVEELRHLLLDSFLVMIESLRVEKITLLALARRVANHTCSTSYEQIWLMATTLQVTQHHDTAKVTDVQ